MYSRVCICCETYQSSSSCQCDVFRNSLTYYSFLIASSIVLLSRIQKLWIFQELKNRGSFSVPFSEISRFDCHENETHYPRKTTNVCGDRRRDLLAGFCNPRICCGKEKLSFTKDCMQLKNSFSSRKNAVPRIRPGFIVTRYSSRNPVCSSVPPHHDRLHLQRLLRLMPNECFKRCAIPNHRRRRLIY